ncbi:hypothetical protein OOU_Y34scaffold00037g51 [Pyricularia oryzae Y34]|uniref:Uncharacterized protein n=1 Tax=Pyricularia oryzae (strain Y34) TaxID=1143189 RepID=A0AA97PAD7_PYRO3|nr:hypothetical protein OOU_Y34scaffold00037g51 [Pyricularia oryzae Y34]
MPGKTRAIIVERIKGNKSMPVVTGDEVPAQAKQSSTGNVPEWLKGSNPVVVDFF